MRALGTLCWMVVAVLCLGLWFVGEIEQLPMVRVMACLGALSAAGKLLEIEHADD